MALVRNVLIRTCVTYVVCFIVSVLFLLVILPCTFLPDSVRYKNRFFYQLTSWWSGVCLWAAGLSVTTVGGGDIPEKPSVFVMNHASALDILLVEKCLGGAPRLWLSKDEYRKAPLLNWVLYRMHVMVNASSPIRAASALKEMQVKAKAFAAHTLLFPEGGRFDDGHIHRFFKGFSLLSTLLNQDVVPIYIDNADKVYPKNSVLLHNASPLTLVVGPLMRRLSGESHEEFAARVRAWFVTQQATKNLE